jgi:ATP-binding cassette subfamily B protein
MKNLIKVLACYFEQSKGYRIQALLAVVFYAIGFGVVEIFRPFFFKEILDGLVDRVMTPERAVVLFLLIQFCFNFFLRGADHQTVKFQSKMIPILFSTAVGNMMKHSSGFFANTFAGKLTAQIRRFVGSFEKMFDEFVYRILVITLYVIGVGIIGFVIHPFFGSIIVIFICIMLTVSVISFKKKLVLDEVVATAESTVIASLSDMLGNIQTIIHFGKREEEKSRFHESAIAYGERLHTTWSFGNKVRLFKVIIASSFEAIMVYFLVTFYLAGEISIGTVSLFIAYMVSISNVMWSLDGSLKTLSKSISDAVEMMKTFETPIEVNDQVTTSPKLVTNPAIILKKISFRYPGGRNIFQDLEITIPAGQKVGICGSTGAGKTTLVNLILRNMDTVAGDIRLDNCSIRDFSQEALKQVIAYVPQNIEMFNRTIRQNISFAKENATGEEIIDAAKRARIHDFIMTLPRGYDTMVGEKGLRLSGGQRQRIGIARAILKNAPILILDEATSALDVVTETEILEILEKEFQGKTVIVIAHRLSTIRNLDRILVFENGKVIQDGTHQELLVQDGSYQKLISITHQEISPDSKKEILERKY